MLRVHTDTGPGTAGGPRSGCGSTDCQRRMSTSFELLVNDFQIGLGLWGGATLHFLSFYVIPFLLVTPITCRNMLSLEETFL